MTAPLLEVGNEVAYYENVANKLTKFDATVSWVHANHQLTLAVDGLGERRADWSAVPKHRHWSAEPPGGPFREGVE